MTHTAQGNDLVTQEVTSKDDIREVLALAQRLTGGERASLMLPLAATSDLHVVAATGAASDHLIDMRVRLGEPVAGLVAETGRSLLVNDERAFASLVGRQPYGARSASFISVPVPLVSERCGVLNIADPIGRAHFRSEDLTALEGFASMLGQLDSLRMQLVRERDRTLALQRELLGVQESERHRLARDLHDEAGHALTLAVFQIDLERIKPTTDPDTKVTLNAARDAVLNCATALNDMAFRLRPRILDDLGLIPALRALTSQIHEVGKIHVSLYLDGKDRALSAEVELVAFRVVQEGLTNIGKHAQAASAWVELSFHATMLEISVCDDGVGTTVEEAMGNPRSSQGLRGMRERVELLDGELGFSRDADRITRLKVCLPI